MSLGQVRTGNFR